MSEEWRNELITKGSAIDALLEAYPDNMDVEFILGRLPSAQPQDIARDIATIIENEKDMRVMLQQRWIQVTERLPEEREWLGTKQFGTTISDEVYVTFENPKGERFCKHLSFQNGKLSAHDQLTIDAFYKGSKPIAWMPLPEPYKGE